VPGGSGISSVNMVFPTGDVNSIFTHVFPQTAVEGVDILLDWMVPKEPYETLENKIKERVAQIGSIQYLDLVRTVCASDTNDTLSALAQPWFGIILTTKPAKDLLIQHIVRDALQKRPTELIVLIDNTNVDLSKFTGSCVLNRMLSGRAGGMERGDPVQVNSASNKLLLVIDADCFLRLL
jgi:hypothetical protein